MEFNYEYAGASAVAQAEGASAMTFVPDALRPPTYFKGSVRETLAFREAMGAMHDVVISDLRFRPKDRTNYLAWRAQQDDVDLVEVTRSQARIAKEIQDVQAQLGPLEREAAAAGAPFHAARARYWNYLYERDRELWFKLDPVITVHPDQVFFECFSRDESTYGRLAASYEGFDQVGERAHGTTNVDYSDALYNEFQKLRSYKRTSLEVDPSGFDVKTSGEEGRREVKIDVPDSWVRGFLQVSSAMTLPTTSVDLHPMDLHNLCLVLRRNKELFGPRSLRYELTPDRPVVIVVEPWNIRVNCPRSIFKGPKAVEIRAWGRRRLHILERLLPRARSIRVHLLGTGLPSFYVADLGELSFTLGLSGWTQNNWSAEGNFDLMVAREDVDSDTAARVFAELGKRWLATPRELAQTLGLDAAVVSSALGLWTQNGRAIYDLEKGVYRKRELTREPLPMERLRYSSEREEKAAQLLHQGKIAVDEVGTRDGNTRIAGRLRFRNKVYATSLVLDPDRRLVQGECTCDYFIRNRLHRGPCDHILALRAAHRRGVSDPDVGQVEPVVARTAGRPNVAASQARTPPGPTAATTTGGPVVGAASRATRAVATAQIEATLNALGDRIVILDRAQLVGDLVAIHLSGAQDNARLFALVAGLRQSSHATQLPPDQALIDVFRAHVRAPAATPETPETGVATTSKRWGWWPWLTLAILAVRLIVRFLGH